VKRQGRTDKYLALCLQLGAHLRYALKLASLQHTPEAVKYALKYLDNAEDRPVAGGDVRESNDAST
jgi:hypothetical protein